MNISIAKACNMAGQLSDTLHFNRNWAIFFTLKILIPLFVMVLLEVKDSKVMQQKNSGENIQKQIKQLQEELKFLKNLMPSNTELNDEEGEDKNRPRLFRNRPNPFIKYTIIKYYVPEGENQRISLFIVDEKGNQKMFWDYLKNGKQKLLIKDHLLIPGIYFYSLVIDGNIVETYKMKIREEQ